MSSVTPVVAFSDGAAQLRALLVTGWRWVLTGRRLGWRSLVAAAWVLGVAGDAFTTITMMHLGVSEEGNAVAAAGMNILTVPGYTALASALCLALGVANCGKPRGLYGHVAFVMLSGICALKLYIAVSNVALWISI